MNILIIGNYATDARALLEYLQSEPKTFSFEACWGLAEGRNLLNSKNFDGVIVSCCENIEDFRNQGSATNEFLRDLEAQNIPFILLNNCRREIPPNTMAITAPGEGFDWSEVLQALSSALSPAAPAAASAPVLCAPAP